MLATYQIITIVLGGFFIIRTLTQYFRHKRPLISSVIWISLWGILLFLALLPDNLSLPLAELLGIASNINAVLFFAMGLLFVAVFQQSATISQLERKLTDLVRELAIKEKIDSEHDA
jgi:hypothetical protein